jgi:hypothetical protein
MLVFGDHKGVKSRVLAQQSRLIMRGGVAEGEGSDRLRESDRLWPPVVGSVAAGQPKRSWTGLTGRTVDPADVRAIADALLSTWRTRIGPTAGGSSGRARTLDRFTLAFGHALSDRLPASRLPLR